MALCLAVSFLAAAAAFLDVIRAIVLSVQVPNVPDQWLAAHGLAITQDDNCESIASRGSGLNPLQTKPFTDNQRNCIHLVGR